MQRPKEICPECGKKYKFLKKHYVRAHTEKIEKIPSFLKEIKLEGEFKQMAETINPKKEAGTDKEPKYKCGACGGSFNERHKRCPHCGVEFE